jgi:hypothetical protein
LGGPLNAWHAHARQGPNRALIGVVLGIPIGLAVLSGVAVATNWDQIVASFQTGYARGLRNPAAATGREEIAVVGQPVELFDGTDADLGSVMVIDTRQPRSLGSDPPPAGFHFVAAEVSYEARSGWRYSTLDWWARDVLGRRYASVAGAPAPALADGMLAAGDSADGWLAFLVPDDVGRLWLDFIAADGSIIFAVQIDGPPDRPTIPAAISFPVS